MGMLGHEMSKLGRMRNAWLQRGRLLWMGLGNDISSLLSYMLVGIMGAAPRRTVVADKDLLLIVQVAEYVTSQS